MRTMRLSRLWALASLSLWIPLSVPSVAIAAESGPLLPTSPSPAEPTVLSRGARWNPEARRWGTVDAIAGDRSADGG
jgi:hypothetical protein